MPSWAIAVIIIAVLALGAVTIVLISPPNTPLCAAYRDLNRTMKNATLYADISAEIKALRDVASKDEDPGVRADARSLEYMGIVFTSDDVKEKTQNIAGKC